MKKFYFSPHFTFRILLMVTITSIPFSSCKEEKEKPKKIIYVKTETFRERVRKLLQLRLEKFKNDTVINVKTDTFYSSHWIYKVFNKNDFFPLWTKDSMLLPNADSLIWLINTASSYGLNASDYHQSFLNSYRNYYLKSLYTAFSDREICEINIYLTDVFFRFITELKKGRLDPFTLNYTWKGNSHDTIPIHLLEQALKHNILNRTINEQQPDQFPYWQLMWRLYHTRDTSQANTIAINMERWRWEKKPDEDYFIWINIPSYTLQLFECDTLALQSRVIVGKPETGTPPRLDSKIVYFWIYPYWMVPLSIATKEILPVLKRDTSYLRRHNMELLNGQNKVLNPNKIQWKNYSEDYFPFKIRQRDGDDNTLGILKFIFPNKLDIYLHDTNVRSLFRKSKRALSHGCIRIEKAKQLAERIITNSKLNYSIDSLHSDLKNKIRKKVSLSTPISIHIRYFTCEANSNGIIFYEDVYGLDEKMKESLKNK